MTYQSWDWSNDGGYFSPKENAGDTTPRGYAIRAIKRELRWLGFDLVGTSTPMVDNGYYGTNMIPNVEAFQESVGLEADGVIGPRTMKELCRKRVSNWEAAVEGDGRILIPNHLLCRTMDLESAWYPACRNTTEDYGLAQIHNPLQSYFNDGSPICPNSDWQYAYRIGVNVKYLAEGLRHNHKWLAGYAPAGTTEEELWKAAVMAHNAPYWAKDWMRDGFPESGGGTVTVGDWSGEKYTWCTLYTNAVYNRTC